MSDTTGQMGLRDALGALWRIRAVDPTFIGATVGALAMAGTNAAAPYVAASLRTPRRPAVIDAYGKVTYRELDERTAGYAAALEIAGFGSSSRAGILCRNHRGFIEANIALARIGATPVYLNTGFAAPQLRDLAEREELDLVIHDAEFTDMVAEAAEGTSRAALLVDPSAADWSFPELDVVETPRFRFKRSEPADGVLLTSGTTGTPKGAVRGLSNTGAKAGLGTIAAVPLAHGDVFAIPAPLFHAWGFAQHAVAALMAGTVVLRDRFDPSGTLDDVRRHEATVLIAVPVMLQRILDLEPAPDPALAASLRIVATSGSALPAELATRWMDVFGDNLYNLYGSTEVGQVTIAGPEDLRADPATSGRPPAGTSIRILDHDGNTVAPGEIGTIHVGSESHFAGYTEGGSKPMVDGFMSTGDRGWIDADGRLRVAGRADDMIVSGGENVYPREVEDLLGTIDGVADVAVVGVDDDEFGQALHAFVVRRDDKAGQAIDAAGLKAAVRDNLARYKVPRRVRFVTEIPRSPTGKIVTRDLV